MAKRGKALDAALREDTLPHVRRTKLSSGKMIKHFRELNDMTQAQLAQAAGLKQSTVSALENEREALGIERAKALALALKVHPAILAFPAWEIEAEELSGPTKPLRKKKVA